MSYTATLDAPFDTSTPMTDDIRNACGETFVDVKGLIISIAQKFTAKHGGDLRMNIADGMALYLRAYQRHDAIGQQYSFEHWLSLTLWSHLTNRIRKAARRHKSTPMQALGDNTDVPECCAERGRWSEIAESLSSDAALVVQLTLETPAELSAAVDAKGGTPCNFRSTLRKHLCGLGWCADRINEAFDQIREALQQ